MNTKWRDREIESSPLSYAHETFSSKPKREENRHFPFRGPHRARSILSRKISRFVPRAILRMIRPFVRISHLRSMPLCWEQYPREEGIRTKNIKAARDAKNRVSSFLYKNRKHFIPGIYFPFPGYCGTITINCKHMDLISDNIFTTFQINEKVSNRF